MGKLRTRLAVSAPSPAWWTLSRSPPYYPQEGNNEGNHVCVGRGGDRLAQDSLAWGSFPRDLGGSTSSMRFLLTHFSAVTHWTLC